MWWPAFKMPHMFWGVGKGVERGCMPLPTRSRWYCNLALLVSLYHPRHGRFKGRNQILIIWYHLQRVHLSVHFVLQWITFLCLVSLGNSGMITFPRLWLFAKNTAIWYMKRVSFVISYDELQIHPIVFHWRSIGFIRHFCAYFFSICFIWSIILFVSVW